MLTRGISIPSKCVQATGVCTWFLRVIVPCSRAGRSRSRVPFYTHLNTFVRGLLMESILHHLCFCVCHHCTRAHDTQALMLKWSCRLAAYVPYHKTPLSNPSDSMLISFLLCFLCACVCTARLLNIKSRGRRSFCWDRLSQAAASRADWVVQNTFHQPSLASFFFYFHGLWAHVFSFVR